MCSLLERIPRDVLENIAYLIATYDILGLPKDLLHLILTCSTFYHSLSISSAPHLYSRIYRTKYDTRTSYHRASVDNLTDSAAATELVLRTRLLRRIRSNDMSKQGLSQDLKTALRMTLESEGLNEAQLHAVPFLPFLFVYVRLAAERSFTQQDSNLPVVLWLLVLHASKADMADLSEDLKNLLHQLVRPLILSSLNRGIVAPSVTSVQLDDSPVLSPDTGSENHLPFPHASSAAIVLSLALHETNNIQIPPHLPINRTTAQSSGRSGPTMEDYRIIAAYKTALFGDDRPLMNKLLGTECDRSRSKRHDPDFHQKMGCGPAPLGAYSYSYIGRFLEGVWEGYYMVSSLNSTTGSGSWKEGASDPPDFLCRRPMQCSLALYYHFDDQQSEVLDCIEEEVVNWSVRACDFSASGTRLELSGVVLPYEKLTGAEDCDHKRLSEANDCLIVGQTLEEHGEAWGAFTFAGRVHRDGRITLKREPRHSSEAGLGTWIFQGHLRFGAAFVGTWSSSSTRDQPGVCGLFSMGKK